MAEGVANFSECEYGRLHVDEDFAAVEFLPAGAGSVYRVIGTNLSNPAMPLIRYDTGDLVRLTDENCPCGRWGRLVGRVDGRQEDYVVLRDGTRIGRMDHVFKDMVRIREAQIRQRQIGSIEVWVVRGTGYADGDERAMLREIGLRLGQDISVSVHYCERLPRTARGKLRLVVSELSVGRIDESEEARQ
jgi:phenylacetate-CoA ligase